MDILVEYSPSQQETIRKSDRNTGVFAGRYNDIESVYPIPGKGYPRFDIGFGSSTYVTRLNGEKLVSDRYTLTAIYGKGTNTRCVWILLERTFTVSCLGRTIRKHPFTGSEPD